MMNTGDNFKSYNNQFHNTLFMKFILSIITIIVISVTSLSAQSIDEIPNLLYEQYEEYEEETIQTRRFKHEDIQPLIDVVDKDSEFTVTQVGRSVEGRSLHLITVGNGPIDIFYWSQMHGDESTATAAIFDMVNFLRDPGDKLEELRDRLLSNATLHFLPMINPDGAERFQRRNVLDIDINRDALRLTSPESKTLKQVRDSLNPAFGFNLHDQSTYYTAGRNPEPATISFLAPAYDYEQSQNEVRTNAMKLIAGLNEVLQQFIPGQVGKYSDDHEPRAFGDMIQKWGTSTVLIESGGYKDDPEKQYIRKLNFILLISAAEQIGQKSYDNHNTDDYFALPENEVSLYDLLIRNAEFERDNNLYLKDLGIRHSEQQHNDDRTYHYRSTISEVGDMSIYYGYRELNAKGLTAKPGKVYEDTLQNLTNLKQLNPSYLLDRGYTDVVLDADISSSELRSQIDSFPLNIILSDDHSHNKYIDLGDAP